VKIVVDTNRIIAALVKDGASREILFDEYFEFITPEYTLTEIEEHKGELLKKIKVTEKEFEILRAFIFEYIEILPREEYQKCIEECKNDISDVDDILHLAACLASKAEGIWAHDPHFKEQQKVKVFTNIDLLRMSGKSRSM
jgi:predicted nucleic acid-binding protein